MSAPPEPVDGCTIVGTLLRNYSGLVGIVPTANIKEGAIQKGAPLPLILLENVSSVEPSQPLCRPDDLLTVDRVAVTIRAASHRERKVIRWLVVRACAGKNGEIAGAKSVAILTAGAGPDLRGPGDSFDKTQDFRVTYLSNQGVLP